MLCSERTRFCAGRNSVFKTSAINNSRLAAWATSVASITALEVERFRISELEGGKTPGTANFAVKVLRSVFNTARRRGLSPTNPAEAIELLHENGEERMT